MYDEFGKALNKIIDTATNAFAFHVLAGEDEVLDELGERLFETLSELERYVDNAIEAQKLMRGS